MPLWQFQKGELRAKQIEYENRKKRRSGLLSSVVGVIASAASTFVGSIIASPCTPGLAGIQALLSGAAGLANIYSSYASTNAIAGNSASTARQLGYIEAQKERIRAFESASMQFASRDINLYQTEEALYEMTLRCERLKLSILLAEQREDMAHGELSNMIGRVAFLLQEWSRATYFATISPLNRADYRLILSLAMCDANEMFSYAQERCYLAAKTAEYRINPDPTLTYINTTIKNIMKARRTEDLLTYLNALKTDVYGQQIKQGARQTDSLKMSVRHFLVQNNDIELDSSGNIIPSQSTFETQLDANGNPSNTQAVSDAAWLSFLQSNCAV